MINRERQELEYFTHTLGYNNEKFTIEQLQEAVKVAIKYETVDRFLNYPKGSYRTWKIIRYEVYVSVGYDDSASLEVQTYRLEDEEEYTTRIEKEEKAAVKAKEKYEKKQTEELAAKQKHEELMKDPEYQQLLKLKEKFNK